MNTIGGCGLLILVTAISVEAGDAPFVHPSTNGLIHAPAADGASAASDVSAGGRIRHDARSLVIDGRRRQIFSGAFHYFRVPRAEWADRFALLRELGINTVETVVPWNRHEPRPPASLADFSGVDLEEFDAWLTMARREGFFIIVRPGPYVCAEVDFGGFPRWLLAHRPAETKRGGFWLRSDDPEFLAWSKHWYQAVVPVIARHQISRLPAGAAGVVAFQLENELHPMFSDFANDQASNAGQLLALHAEARRLGIDVQFITCWSGEVRMGKVPELAGFLDGSNTYPIWNVGQVYDFARQSGTRTKPGFISELQGGWFSSVGGRLSEDVWFDPKRFSSPEAARDLADEQIRALSLLAVAGGASITNYYMLVGGTSLGLMAGRGIPTTYDYDAPIKEGGGRGPRYEAVRGVGAFIKRWESELLETEPVAPAKSESPAGVGVQLRAAATGERAFVFVHNGSFTERAKGVVRVELPDGRIFSGEVELSPFDARVMVFPEREIWPRDEPARSRPAAPSPARIEGVWTRACDEGADRKPAKDGESLVDAGVFDSRWTLYASEPVLNASQVASFSHLVVERWRDDPIVVRVNGVPVAPGGAAAGPWGRAAHALGSLLRAGKNRIEVLHEDAGTSAIGAIDHRADYGVRRVYLTTPPPPDATDTPASWRVRVVASDEAPERVREPLDDAWAEVPAAELGTRLPALLRESRVVRPVVVCRTALPAGTALLFGGVVRMSEVFLDGRRLPVNPQQSQPWLARVIPGAFKTAELAVVAWQEGGLSPFGGEVVGFDAERFTLPIGLTVARRTGGESAEWWRAEAGAEGWLPFTPGSAPVEDAAWVRWYRIEFTMPADDEAVFAPWRARIEATGNGWLWLNGEPLGRYYDAGPQQEFSLPVDRLSHGGKRNVITLALRATERGRDLRRTTVAPQADFVESRR